MPSLTCTLIQSILHWKDKQANLKMFEKKIASIQQKTEVIILPEMFNTGFVMEPETLAEKMDGETMQWIKNTSAKYNIVLTGSLMIEEDNNYYNRLIWMLPNGNCGYYDKRHLFAYANEHKHFSEGNKRLIASVKGWRLNMLVCYDLRFPVWSRQCVKDDKPEYDVLIYVANWPAKRSLAWQSLLQARAIENQCYVIGVNRVGDDGNHHKYNGDSMVINALGEIIYHKENEEDIFTVTLDDAHLAEVREYFPFWKDGDKFFISNE